MYGAWIIVPLFYLGLWLIDNKQRNNSNNIR